MGTLRPVLVSAAMLLILVAADRAAAQRLYDEARDKEAQAAAKLADEITSKSSFEKQLKNVDTLSQRDLEVYFRGAQRQMELDIRTFRTWEDVRTFVENTKTTLGAADFISDDVVKATNSDLKVACQDKETDAETRTTELGKAICLAKIRLSVLKRAVDDSKKRGDELDEELESRLEKIDAVNALVQKATTYLKAGSSQNEIIKGFSDVFINLSKSYVNYVNKIEQIKNAPTNDLKLLLQRIAVEALQLEADHWKTVAEIKRRRGEEQTNLKRLTADVDERLGEISKCLSVEPAKLDNQKLTDTFATAKALPKCAISDLHDFVAGDTIEMDTEEIISYLFQTLHSTAALTARGETPMKLAQLRLAQEEHRYSIRHSAIMARGYELALASGTKRLARFYAGGIKPEKIAQLIYTAATVAIPSVLAAK